jgi:transcriptional regulator with XRE-family HTH domain
MLLVIIMPEFNENNEILNRILETMKKRGVRQKEMTQHLGITEPAFTRWKYAGSSSYLKYIDSIAEYLNVPSDYLLYGTVDGGHIKQITFEDLEILNSIADLTPEEKQFVKNTILFLQTRHISNNSLR